MKIGSNVTLATELEIRESIADIRAALADGPILPNIWGFYSPKNARLITLLGDVTFIQAVLLEGDPEVSSYSVQTEIDGHDDQTYGRILVVQRRDGARDWLFCCRYESSIKSGKNKFSVKLDKERRRAENAGFRFLIRTERDFATRMTEFWNWLALCSAMTRARDFSHEKEFMLLSSHLAKHKTCTFHGAMGMPDADPALMIAAIARQLAFGQIACDLRNQPLNVGTEFRQGPPTSCAISQVTKKDACAIADKRSSQPLPRSRRTAKVPEIWRDLSTWPTPSIENLEDAGAYRRNRKAVEMYFSNHDFATIKAHTGLGEDWIRELAKKCVKPHHDGRIFGFRALVKYLRIEGYNRSAPLASSNLHEGKKGGYAGAMTSLFVRFPDLLNRIENYVLQIQEKFCANLLTARARWVDLKDEVHRYLEAQGLGKNDYPFNTRDQGYATLAALARSILFKRPLKFIKSRHGRNAGRLAEVRRGEPSLIQPTAPFQVLEADFHKHDSAATVELQSPTGAIVDAPVPRFWIGCVVDAFQRAILATSDSFEAQTTESCVLDLIDAAVAPPDAIDELREFAGCIDGYWQPNQTLPEFAWHGWDIIKLDRAWAHKSTSVLSKLVSTVGCAVCFGRPRAWWTRAIVERTFRELTANGAQRLSTTYGTGPGDPHRDKPEEKAVVVRLRRNEICHLAKSIVRELNSTIKEGNFWEAPLDSLRRSNSDSKYFPRPMPLQRRTDRPTLWATALQKVEAYPERGVLPCVRVHRCRYHGRELNSAWGLVGEKIVLEISRRDIQVARAINPKTGELIGYLRPEKRWRNVHISWQNFLMLQKFGRIQRDHQKPESATNSFTSDRQEKIFGKGKTSPTDAKKAASDLDKLQNDIKGGVEKQHEFSTSSVQQNDEEWDGDAGSSQDGESELSWDALLGPAPDIGSFSRR